MSLALAGGRAQPAYSNKSLRWYASTLYVTQYAYAWGCSTYSSLLYVRVYSTALYTTVLQSNSNWNGAGVIIGERVREADVMLGDVSSVCAVLCCVVLCVLLEVL